MRRKPPRTPRGFSLAEVVVATGVFVALAAGVLATVVQARRGMNEALIRNVAFDAAQSFLDQIKGANSFQTLLNATPPVGVKGGQLTLAGIEVLGGTITPKALTLSAFSPNSAAANYTAYSLPLNAADSTDVAALKNMGFVKDYGLLLELSKLESSDIGPDNAVLVTLRFRYKQSAGDAAYRTGAVFYIAPRFSI